MVAKDCCEGRVSIGVQGREKCVGCRGKENCECGGAGRGRGVSECEGVAEGEL